MRLQDTYKLNTSHLANGEISSKFKSKRLSGTSHRLRSSVESSDVSVLALECYDLGRIAYTNGDFYHTLMWMQEALDHLASEKNKSSISKIDILDHLAYATSQVSSSLSSITRADNDAWFSSSKAMWNTRWQLRKRYLPSVSNRSRKYADRRIRLRIAPNHVRAKNNKVYYETVIHNRTLASRQRNQTLLTTKTTDKAYTVHNERPDDFLEERDIYEKLCRQNGTQVRMRCCFSSSSRLLSS